MNLISKRNDSSTGEQLPVILPKQMPPRQDVVDTIAYHQGNPDLLVWENGKGQLGFRLAL